MIPPGPHILVIDDDEDVASSLCRLLERRGYRAEGAVNGEEARSLVRGRKFDVALVDLQLPDVDGYELIRGLRKSEPDLDCIAMTGYGSPLTAARAAGAAAFVAKPIAEIGALFRVIERLLESRAERHSPEAVSLAGHFLGSSNHAQQVRSLIRRFAGVGAAVLITGESGVGKEIVAEALHQQSHRTGAFVRINCAALPGSLIESELFGAEAGTFTGQRGRRTGLFEAAAHGTVFLDEIGELPLELQPKLLRVLQSQAFRPLGSNLEQPLTARVIAATNRDLERSVARSAFREDLYFRLCVLRMHIAPLRERREDIAVLAQHFLDRHAAIEGRTGLRLLPDAIRALVAQPWIGNARELANVLLRAVILTDRLEVGAADLALPASAAHATASRPKDEVDDLLRRPFGEARTAANERFSRRYLQELLARNDGNVSGAAREAGVLRPNLRRELKRYGVVSEG